MLRNGGKRFNDRKISSNSGSRLMTEIEYAEPIAARAASFWSDTSPPFSVRAMARNRITAMQKEGTVVQSSARMCWKTSTPPTSLGTRIVVSESGVSLSPR